MQLLKNYVLFCFATLLRVCASGCSARFSSESDGIMLRHLAGFLVRAQPATIALFNFSFAFSFAR
jgi:hypothetical protein